MTRSPLPLHFRRQRLQRRNAVALGARGPSPGRISHISRLLDNAEKGFRKRVIFERKTLAGNKGLSPEQKEKLNRELDLDLQRRAFRYSVRKMEWSSKKVQDEIVRVGVSMARARQKIKQASPEEKKRLHKEILEKDKWVVSRLGNYWFVFLEHFNEYYRGVRTRYAQQGREKGPTEKRE